MAHGTVHVTPNGHVVYCLMDDREAFDKIDAPATVHEPKPGETPGTLTTKIIHEFTGNTYSPQNRVMVVFQYWQPVEVATVEVKE